MRSPERTVDHAPCQLPSTFLDNAAHYYSELFNQACCDEAYRARYNQTEGGLCFGFDPDAYVYGSNSQGNSIKRCDEFVARECQLSNDGTQCINPDCSYREYAVIANTASASPSKLR